MTHTKTLTPPNLERAIQFGLLLILALMPFHAFLSVWLGSLTGHQNVIQAWKEIALLILTALTAGLLIREPSRLARLRQPWILAAAAFALVAFIVTAITQPPLTAVAFGAKTDLEFLLAAAIAAVAADRRFINHAVRITLAAAALVIAFGLLQMFVLPRDFLTHFGYGPSTVVPYELIGGTNIPRFAATLGGPNQLGTYLILPLALSVALALARRRWWLLALSAGSLMVLWGTASRSAWIGAVAAIVLTWTAAIRGRLRRPFTWGLGIVGLVLVLAGLILALHSSLQHYLLHNNSVGGPSSDSQHAASLRNGFNDLIASPLGHGLGSAGPATFHAGTITILEDYYLQISYETGLLGLLAFIVIVAALIMKLRPHLPEPATLATVAAIIGISLVALVLPAWTDSSTALIAWIMGGALAGLTTTKPEAHHV